MGKSEIAEPASPSCYFTVKGVGISGNKFDADTRCTPIGNPSQPPQASEAAILPSSHTCCRILCEHEARCGRNAAVGVHCVLRRKNGMAAGGDMRAWQHVLNVPVLPCAFHSTVSGQRASALAQAQTPYFVLSCPTMPAHYRRLLVRPQMIPDSIMHPVVGVS